MKDVTRYSLVLLLMAALAGGVTWADDDVDTTEGEAPAVEVVNETDVPEAAEGHSRRAREILHRIRPYVAETFEYVNTEEDLVRGFVTHSVPDGTHYRAYVFLIWGDLDREIEGISSDYYNNWDGFVDVDEGRARVAREFAFDDGTPMIGWGMTQKFHDMKEDFKAKARLVRDAAKDRARRRIHDEDRLRSRILEIDRRYDQAVDNYSARIQELLRKARQHLERHGQPQEGSGVDALVADGDHTRVTWEAGVVGATDGLLIELDLPADGGAVTVQAGEFTQEYVITPLPDEKTIAVVRQAIERAEDDAAEDETSDEQ